MITSNYFFSLLPRENYYVNEYLGWNNYNEREMGEVQKTVKLITGRDILNYDDLEALTCDIFGVYTSICTSTMITY